jgi:hypothetical protein
MPCLRPILVGLAASLLLSCGAPPPRSTASVAADRCVDALVEWGAWGGLPDALADPAAPPLRAGPLAEAYRRECFGVSVSRSRRACEDGDARACLALGIARGASPDAPLAPIREAWSRACAGGQAYACFLEGVACARLGEAGCAEAKLRAACEGGVPAGCGAWGMRSADRQRAVERACAGGHLPACLRVARRSAPAVAARAARRLCAAGVGRSCHRSVQQWMAAAEPPFDAHEAARLAIAACNAGDGDLCRGASAAALERRRAERQWRARCDGGDGEACIATLDRAYEAGLDADADGALVRFCTGDAPPSACAAACRSHGRRLVGTLATRCLERRGDACRTAARLVHAGCGAAYDEGCVRRLVFASCAGRAECPAWEAIAHRREGRGVSCPMPAPMALRLHDAASVTEVAAALTGPVDARALDSLQDLSGAAPRVFPAIDALGRRIAVPEPFGDGQRGAIRLLRARNAGTIETLPIWEPPPADRPLAAYVHEHIHPLYEALPRRLEGYRPMRRVPEGRAEAPEPSFRREGRALRVSVGDDRVRVRLPAPRGCAADAVRVWADRPSGWVLVEHRACGAVTYLTGEL